MAETVIIRFKGEDDVSSVASDIEGKVADVGKAADGVSSRFSSLKEIGIGALRGIGELALDVGKNALSGTFDFFKSAVQGAAEYQSALAQTEAVIDSTGGAAGLSVKQMEDLARGLSAANGQSLFTDDQLLSAQNVLATFTEIKGTNFADATGAIANLSQAMGQDLKSSAVQVGKALNNPLEGLSALTRVGVGFSEEQKNAVAALMETGDVAGAQKIILGELERQFGGSAAAATQTFAGQMVVMSEKIEDAKGAIGDALLPLLSEMTKVFSEQILPIIQDVTARIGEFFQGISDSGGVMASLDGIKQSIMGFIESQPVLQKLIELGTKVWETLTSLFADTMLLASDPAVQNWLGQVAEVLQGVFIVAVDAVILALDLLRIAFGYIVDGIRIFAEAMTPIFNYVYPKLTEVLNAISSLLRGDFTEAWNTIKGVVSGVWEDIKATTLRIAGEISTRVGTFIDETIGKAKQLGKDIVDGITQGINDAKDKVREALANAIKAGIDFIKKFLGIASPSRLMAESIGAPIAQGIAAGIVSGVPDIQKALGLTVAAGTGAPTQSVQNFYLTANYQTAQSQSSLTADLRAMQLLAGGVA
jgi:phage-related protein